MDPPISSLVASAERGDRCAVHALFTALYSDLHRLAKRQLLSRISAAVDALAAAEPALAELVDLKFFCGFSLGEIAAMRGVSERTVQRQWEKARIFLHRTIRGASLT